MFCDHIALVMIIRCDNCSACTGLFCIWWFGLFLQTTSMGHKALFLYVLMELRLSQLEKKLTAMLESPVAAIGFELIGIEFVRAGKHSTLRVFIDSENGIEVDDCAQVSHQISAVLDVEDPISTEYNLEVSSPGMDRPLFKVAHYQQVVGQEINVKLQTPQDGRRNFKGRLLSCEALSFKMQVDKQEFELAFDNVLKANLVPIFD